MDDVALYLGDCLVDMSRIPDGSVDMILADLPYGTTACHWDSVIPLEPLWTHYKRIIKPRGAIVLTVSQPFTTTLIASNMAWFKYCWVWEKEQGSNPFNAPFQPIKVHEDVVVFSQAAASYSRRGTMVYKPQMTEGASYKGNTHPGKHPFHAWKHYAKDNAGTRYPTSVLGVSTERGLHETQKPVALMEYLIRTYTNEGELVMDNTMGSGTTGVACVNTSRHFVGIERDKNYFAIAQRRIAEAQQKKVEEASRPQRGRLSV